jgi:hypothetical protein
MSRSRPILEHYPRNKRPGVLDDGVPVLSEESETDGDVAGDEPGPSEETTGE